MTYYLVDTENVQTNWSQFIDSANNNDCFVLFYSVATAKISMSLFGPASIRNIQFKFIECYTGHNGMDFQIATELGYLVSQNPENNFVIISKDTGFDVLTKYWTDRHINIQRKAPVMETPKITIVEPTPETVQSVVQPNAPTPNPEILKLKTTYKELLKACDIPESELTKITNIVYISMAHPQNERKLKVFNQLQSIYGTKQGQLLYNQIKDTIKDLSVNGPFPIEQIKPAKKPATTLETIQLACPNLNKKDLTKVENVLKNSNKTKKASQRPESYKKQLKAMFKKTTANEIFEHTKHLLKGQ